MDANSKKKSLSLEIVRQDEGSSFRFIHNELPYFNFPWHYHSELEISLVTKGSGLRIVGDSIEEFQEGDLCFFGTKVPHTWYSQPKENSSVSSLVIQFSQDFIDDRLAKFPEFHGLAKILPLAKRGMLINGESRQAMHSLFIKMQQEESNSPLRISYFLNLIGLLIRCEDYKLLTTATYQPPVDKKSSAKVETICKMVHDNLHSPLTQNWVATQVNMSSASFSRYFRRVFGKSYIEYINELRIGMACRRLLEDPDVQITDIAFSLGFNNLTNFNRLFKRYKGTTPRNYRQIVDSYAVQDSI